MNDRRQLVTAGQAILVSPKALFRFNLQHLAQTLKLTIITNGDDEMTIGAGKGGVRHNIWMGIPHPRRGRTGA